MDTKELQNKLILFLDAIGRVIIGEKVDERDTDTQLVVKNPVIIHVEAKNGNIAIQFFPILFKEFLGSKEDGAIFTYNKNNISIMDKSIFDFKLYAQYNQMFYTDGSTQPLAQNTNSEPEVIKLFDE